MQSKKFVLNKFRMLLDNMLNSFNFGMHAKLVILFVFIKVIPLILLALVAWYQAVELGNEMRTRTKSIVDQAVQDLENAEELAVDDAVKALDESATDEIERMTTDAANALANFLYARDDDLRFLSTITPSENIFKNFLASKTGLLIKPRKWVLAEDGKSWVPTTEYKKSPIVQLKSNQNKEHFRSRPPDNFEYERVPLYLEATFIDLNGQELIKVTTSELMNPDLKNVSDTKNTFCKAEDYFTKLKKLKAGEIYVSEVIGEYIGSNIIGMYTPQNAKSKNVNYEPEKSAYVGDENPNGKRFQGLVRFAMPVEQDGKITGYVTIALNHSHIMAKVEHLAPNKSRYSDINAAAEGNYTFMWDSQGYNIFHPRHHSIAGFDAQTGKRQPSLLDAQTYNKWQESGLEYLDFIEDEPSFNDQRRARKPAIEQIQQGNIGLDCRYLNFAPQCTGWYNLAQHGGSGSFLLLWSDIWKLTTVSAIPYYTGKYGEKKIGFGIVTMTVCIDDFHRPALETRNTIQSLINKTDEELSIVSDETINAISTNLWNTAKSLTLYTLVMTILVVFIAIWMASIFTQKITILTGGISRFSDGHRRFRFNSDKKDEVGSLCSSLDELFNGIVNSTKNPLTITDLGKNIIYMNQYALDILDKDFEEVQGQSYPVLSIFGDKKGSIATFLENTPSSISFYAPTKCYYKANTSYLLNKEGEKIGFIIEAEDVTQLILEQESIERERALLDMVFASSPDIMWYKTTNGEYRVTNKRFANLLGFTPEELQGKFDKDILSKDLCKNCVKYDKEVIETGSTSYNESLISFPDGHKEVVDIARTPIFGSDGKVCGILGIGRDVTLRVHAERELLQAQSKLLKAVDDAIEASNAKSEFLARMSHEIRTPMNAIMGMTNIVKRKLDEDNCCKENLLPNIAQIDSSSMHLLGLLNDILDISKIEAGKIEISHASFDLSKLISEIVATITPRCESKNIEFIVNTDGLVHKQFISDELRIRQVILNLLGNAAKFTSELGSITFHVEQKDSVDGKALLFFSIADTGIGISPEKLKSLFIPFEQGGGHITRIYGGTGLGLSISRSIARMLGSEIEVISEENKGSEFFFSLWLLEDDDSKALVDTHEAISIKAGKRILLVDDVEINRIIAMELLSPFNLIIDEARDGTDALQMFTKTTLGYYDMIFMDIQMPKMDGYETTKAIRALKRKDASTTPIVAMTANAFRDDIDMAFASGMNGHIAKPISPNILYSTLDYWLNKNEK